MPTNGFSPKLNHYKFAFWQGFAGFVVELWIHRVLKWTPLANSASAGTSSDSPGHQSFSFSPGKPGISPRSKAPSASPPSSWTEPFALCARRKCVGDQFALLEAEAPERQIQIFKKMPCSVFLLFGSVQFFAGGLQIVVGSVHFSGGLQIVVWFCSVFCWGAANSCLALFIFLEGCK